MKLEFEIKDQSGVSNQGIKLKVTLDGGRIMTETLYQYIREHIKELGAWWCIER